MSTYLDGITSSLKSSLLREGSGIVIEVVADELHIDPDHAVPMGLLATELSINAAKYAFPAGRGRIEIGFRRRDGEVILRVQDDGTGISGNTEGSGMGTRFVGAFAKQLGGSVATASGATGTTVTVRLPATILAT